jgi:ATP/maltotriose-dependent transcriptional regulator MalT
MGPEGRHRAAAVTAGGSIGAVVAGPSRADRAVVRRPALEARLDAFVGRRLVTVVAGPGSGKSTLLRGWAAHYPHAWRTATSHDAKLATFVGGLIDGLRAALPGPIEVTGPLEAAALAGSLDETPERIEALAGFLCSLVDATLDQEFVLVIDDLHELGATSASARLVASLCRNAPPRLHLVLASRDEMPFPTERLAAHGDVAQFDAQDLAFDAPEIASVLEASGIAAPDGLAEDLARATNGWPAAVRLAVEAIRARPGQEAAALADLHRPGGPLFVYLATEVFERQSADVRELIRTVAPLDRFTPELCVALGIADAEATIRWLAARGLFIQRTGDQVVMHGLVRDFAQRSWPLEPAEARRILVAAAAWHADQGHTEVAIGLAAKAADWSTLGWLLVSSGPELLRSGGARALVDAAEQLPDDVRIPAVARVVGEAYASLGLSGAALDWLDLAAPSDGPVPVDVAWRRAMSHYLRDELHEVVRIHDSTDLNDGRPADVAQLAAWTAGAYRRLGDGEKARELAGVALAAAARSNDGPALAAAHMAGAFAAEIAGDRVAATRHMQQALSAAEQSGDLLQTVRIRNNRGSDLLESGSYAQAIEDFDAALEVASLAGFVSLRALALMNRGLANWCLGRLEEASADYEASIEAYRTTGSRELAYAVIGRGDVYRERGDLELARVSYEEGLALAERTGDRQALVPGL